MSTASYIHNFGKPKSTFSKKGTSPKSRSKSFMDKLVVEEYEGECEECERETKEKVCPICVS